MRSSQDLSHLLLRIKFGLKLKLKSTLPVVRLCDNPFTLEGAGARGLADSASYRVCRGFVRHGVYEGFGGATFILCSTLSLLEYCSHSSLWHFVVYALRC